MASTKRKNIDYIKNEIKNITNNEYECISNEYTNQSTKLIIRHYIDNSYHDYETTWKDFKAGRRCKECDKKRKKEFGKHKSLTLEEVKNNIKKMDSNYECIDDKYLGSDKPLKLKHLVCGNKITMRYNDFQQGHRCKICSDKNKGKYQIIPYEDVKNYIEKDNEYILLTKKENYIDASTILKIKHIKCSNDFPKTFSCFKNQNQGCPHCCYIKSKKEKEISNYLIENNIEFVFQKKFDDCKDANVLPFDFYIPSKNLIIEYDGRHHYISIPKFGGDEYLEIVKKHDEIKNKYCKNNSIELLRISYLDDKNIINILDNKLKN